MSNFWGAYHTKVFVRTYDFEKPSTLGDRITVS